MLTKLWTAVVKSGTPRRWVVHTGGFLCAALGRSIGLLLQLLLAGVRGVWGRARGGVTHRAPSHVFNTCLRAVTGQTIYVDNGLSIMVSWRLLLCATLVNWSSPQQGTHAT